MKNTFLRTVALTLTLSVSAFVFAAETKTSGPTLKPGKNGIEYTADSRGNRVLDYSYCGYRQSTANIPDVPVAVVLSPKDGDQSAEIQRAIDYVSSLKPNKATGLRGAVLLEDGTYNIHQSLRISASGVVIAGTSKKGTILRKHGVDRGAVIYIEGINDRKFIDTVTVANDYVPLNSKELQLSSALPADADVVVLRPSTKEWIESIGCDVFGGGLGYWGWKPGEMDVLWERKVVAATGNGVTLDAPLTIALDKQWGACLVMRYTWQGRISDSGVENLTIESVPSTQNPMDEDHAWDGIYIEAAKDCWVRNVDFSGLAGSAVIVHRGGSQITVEDCCSRNPVSEIGGLRRRTFLTMGGKTLFQRCWSEEGINDFSAGYCAPGPNAFVQCDAIGSHGFSGSSSSWATGLLFDNVNVEGGYISFRNLGLDKWGAGWNTANSVMWQCSASQLDCYNVDADNRCYAVGCWSYCQGDGYWSDINNHINPRSLFNAQLLSRIESEGGDVASADARCRVLVRSTDASTSPTLAKAAEMALEALKPRLTLEQWIDQAPSITKTGGKRVQEVSGGFKRFQEGSRGFKRVQEVSGGFRRVQEGSGDDASAPVISDGLLVLDSQTMLSGTFHRTPWWNGRTRYPYMAKADYAVTRFVPGMEQRGGTDRMDSVMVNLDRQNVVVWNQNYGLWYDRRRDDHERIKRPNGDVWAPFFEQAIARSGVGAAWDGLSKYDLTKLNKWYFHRIGQLADQRRQMVIINQHYFQHNILEAGAHWVDAPWRSANNINATGFHEPVPFTGDKRIFTADAFYDVTNSHRAELHRQYIWNVLDALADKPNVYHSISEEYTGPLHFIEFWLDCIAQWQQKTGKDANIILNCTYDVQQAIMAQPKYADLVDIIEIEQWFYDNGKEFKPEGGRNLAPRQHMRLQKTNHPTFQDVYRAVSEMRQAYPTKPVLYYAKEYDRHPWAVVFAGGSCPVLNIGSQELAQALSQLRPDFGATLPDGLYSMSSAASNGSRKLIYNTGATDISLSAVGIPAKAKLFTVNQKSGALTPLKSATIPANTIVLSIH